MGREIRRVPLDFSWSLNKPWHGFINNHYSETIDCPHCENGYTPEYKALESKWYLHMNGGFKPEDRGSIPYLPTDPIIWNSIKAKVNRDVDSQRFYGTSDSSIMREAIRMCEIYNSSWSHHLNQDDINILVKEGCLMDFTHTWSKDTGWVEKNLPYIPTPKEVNDWSLNGFGHDSMNCWIVIKAELARQGVTNEGTCPHCEGYGYTWPSEEARLRAENWKETPVPSGPAYQLWETVSEGSPISPPFATPEELANWLVIPGNGWSTDQGRSRESWLKFIKSEGWAPSMVAINGEIMSGVDAVIKE